MIMSPDSLKLSKLYCSVLNMEKNVTCVPTEGQHCSLQNQEPSEVELDSGDTDLLYYNWLSEPACKV